jgi:hypothetical protein
MTAGGFHAPPSRCHYPVQFHKRRSADTQGVVGDFRGSVKKEQ